MIFSPQVRLEHRRVEKKVMTTLYKSLDNFFKLCSQLVFDESQSIHLQKKLYCISYNYHNFVQLSN